MWNLRNGRFQTSRTTRNYFGVRFSPHDVAPAALVRDVLRSAARSANGMTAGDDARARRAKGDTTLFNLKSARTARSPTSRS